MDPDALSTILKGTLVISGTSAFVTGIHAILTRSAQYGIFSSVAAVNSGITAATFFSIREYAVSPVLVANLPGAYYARQRVKFGLAHPPNSPGPPENISFTEMRTAKVIDSGVSGALTGGILRGWRSGPRAILPGAFTAAAVCGLLQLGYNELAISRLKYISHLEEKANAEKNPPLHLEPTAPPSEPTRPVAERILGALGLRPVSDDEYLAKMKRTREIYMKRIGELEKEVADSSKEAAS